MINRALSRVATLALLAMASTACYTYQVVETPAPGTNVRAALTVEGAVRQSEFLGEPVRNLSGKLVTADENVVRLDVITASSRGTFNDIVIRDTLSIPGDQIVALEQREVSWIRTALIAAAVTTVGVVGISSLTSGGENIDGGGEPGTTFEGIRFPIFRIGW